MRTVSPYAPNDRIFAQTELPKLLSNPAITHINGVPIEIYQAEFARSGSLIEVNKMVSASSAELVRNMGYSIVIDANGNRIITAVDSASLFKGTGYAGETVPSGVRSALVVIDSAVHAEGLANITNGARIVGLVEGVANKAGLVAVGIGAAIAFGEAKAAADQGDNTKAASIVADWGAKLIVGFKAGVVAAQTVGAATIGLEAIPVWGQAAHAAITFAAGIAGALAGEALYEQSKKIMDVFMRVPGALENISDDIKRQLLRFRGIPIASDSSGQTLDDAIAANVTNGDQYAFTAAGELLAIQGSGAFDANLIILSGPNNKGDTLTVSVNAEQSSAMWNATLSGLALGLVPPDVNELAYTTVRTSAATGLVTLSVVTPVREDGGVVGQKLVVSTTLGNQEIDTTTTTTRRSDLGQLTTVGIKKYGANNEITNHTSNTTNRDGTDQIVGSVDITFDANGSIARTTTFQRNTDGTTTSVARDGIGVVISATNGQIFDDGSALSTTTYPSGHIVEQSTDSTGAPFSQRITTPTGNNTETIETYGYSADGKAQLQSSRAVEYIEDANGRSHIDTLTVYGSGEPVVTRVVYNPDGTIASSEVVVPPASAANTVNIDGIAALNDIAGLISAIQNGKPLPILSSGLHLLNTLSGGTVPNIANANSIVSGLSSLYNLHNTLAHSGNTLGKLNATLSTLNYVNTSLPQLISGPGTAVFSPALNGFLNGTGTGANGAFAGLGAGNVPGVLPVLGLIISIKNGDPIGTVSGIIGLLNPAWLAGPVGWILAGASILNALFNNKAPPEAWGSAKFVLDANGHITIDTVGESFGKDRVSQQLGNTLSYLNSMIAQVQAVSPNTPLGLIAQRTPTLSWREARQSDKGYALIDIDPVTGQQRYPYLRFDDNGVPFSSNPALWQPDPLGFKNYYAFDSCSRIFHAGYGHKTHLKEAANDAGWRVAA